MVERTKSLITIKPLLNTLRKDEPLLGSAPQVFDSIDFELNELYREYFKMSKDLAIAELATGWGFYQDGQYTSGSPLVLVGGVPLGLSNDKSIVIESQKPLDVTTFYDGSKIPGRLNDGLIIHPRFTLKTKTGATSSVKIWVDIGGSFGRLFEHEQAFATGNNVEHRISFSLKTFNFTTWVQNGATLNLEADGAAEIFDISYVISRFHKGDDEPIPVEIYP